MDEGLRALLEELAVFGRENDDHEADREQRMLNITPETGQLLAILVRATGARRVLEVGTSNGYSTIWLAWAVQATGGHVITIERAGIDEDRVMEVALEGGAEDVREAGDLLEVLTTPDHFEAVKAALEKAGVALASAEVTMVPSSSVSIAGKNAEQMVRLLETLEDHDDVQTVSSNMDIAAEELERLSA